MKFTNLFSLFLLVAISLPIAFCQAQPVKRVVQCADSSGGGNDTYTATAVPALGSYVDGQWLEITVLTVNTGAATMDCGPGAKTIVKLQGGVSTTLANNDLVPKGKYIGYYNTTDDNIKIFSMVGAAAGGGSSTVRDSIWLGWPAVRDNATTRGGIWTMSSASYSQIGSSPDAVNVAAMVDAADTTAQTAWMIPTNWDSTAAVDIYVRWSVSSAVSTSWRAEVKVACSGTSDDFSSPSYNTTSASSLAYGGASNRVLNSAFTSISMTNCAAGEMARISVMRDGDGTGGTDDMTQSVIFYGVEVVFTRTNP